MSQAFRNVISTMVGTSSFNTNSSHLIYKLSKIKINGLLLNI